MKRLLLIVIALSILSVSTSAENNWGTFEVVHFDTVLGSDSGQVRIDTLESPWQEMIGRFFNFAVEVISGTRDTNFVDDSMFLDLQLKFPGTPEELFVTIEIDTAFDTLSAIQEDLLDHDATVMPQFGRLRYIYYDSFPVGTGIPDTLPSELNNIYNRRVLLHWNGVE